MARYEVAVDASFELSPRRKDWTLGDPLEPVEVWFQGRRFVWHPGDHETYPVVSTMIDDPEEYAAERLATHRFLSALTYGTYSATVLFDSAAGYKDEFDPPLINQPRLPAMRQQVAPELVMADDDESLARCLALLREGNSSNSRALKFLSYWKVVELAVGEAGFKEWVEREVGERKSKWIAEGSDDHEDWYTYLKQSRIAAAHALPYGEGSFKVDPDDPTSRRRLAGDARKFQELARAAIEEKWPKPVVPNDPPDERLGRNELWPPRLDVQEE